MSQVACGGSVYSYNGTDWTPFQYTWFASGNGGQSGMNHLMVPGSSWSVPLSSVKTGDVCPGAGGGFVLMSVSDYDLLRAGMDTTLVVFAIVMVCFAIGIALGFKFTEPRSNYVGDA